MSARTLLLSAAICDVFAPLVLTNLLNIVGSIAQADVLLVCCDVIELLCALKLCSCVLCYCVFVCVVLVYLCAFTSSCFCVR